MATRKTKRTRKNRGFTLIEILIVVIILGILAAIVIPQFTNASEQAKVSSMASQLQTLRSQIGTYVAQHGGTAPGAEGSVLAPWGKLTEETDSSGTLTTATNGYGPYFLNPVANPLVPVAGQTTATVVTSSGAVTPDGTAGWYYNATTGEIHGVAPNPSGDGTFILSDDGSTTTTFTTGAAGSGG